jgi:hypothetical protein
MREGQGHPLAHAYETVVGCHHKETVIRTAAEKAKHCSLEIPLVTSEIGERDNLGLHEEAMS